MSESIGPEDYVNLSDSTSAAHPRAGHAVEPRELSDAAFRTEGTPASAASESRRPRYRPYRLKLKMSVPLEFE